MESNSVTSRVHYQHALANEPKQYSITGKIAGLTLTSFGTAYAANQYFAGAGSFSINAVTINLALAAAVTCVALTIFLAVSICSSFNSLQDDLKPESDGVARAPAGEIQPGDDELKSENKRLEKLLEEKQLQCDELASKLTLETGKVEELRGKSSKSSVLSEGKKAQIDHEIADLKREQAVLIRELKKANASIATYEFMLDKFEELQQQVQESKESNALVDLVKALGDIEDVGQKALARTISQRLTPRHGIIPTTPRTLEQCAASLDQYS